MIKAVRGTRDLLPPETAQWNFVEGVVREVFGAYNFQEIRTPIFEATELFARGVGEATDIVTKEMFTWSDGERFNEKQITDDWLKRNQADDPTHVQAGRINVQGAPPFLAKLKELGIQFQVWRGISVRPNLLGGRVEFVAFRPRVDAQAIAALTKARLIAKSDFSHEFGSHAILLRLVVPDAGVRSSPWVDAGDVEIESFPGNYFSSSQSLTLRPENTAGVVRAYIEHGLEKRGLNKLYYIGPQFRRERPQKGRYRQFYQIGAEVIGPASAGSESPVRDAELLEMLVTLLDRLGITGSTLELNSVGSSADRVRFNDALREALTPVVGQMCGDCQRRAVTNPLRVLDCKVPEDQPIIEKLPRITAYLDDESRKHFAAVKNILRAVGVEFKENDRLVRGLDYYTRTAFEFTHGALGAQNAILGGGRYDGLSEMLGGPPAPGIGFAIGEDRLVMSLAHSMAVTASRGVDVYVAPEGTGMNSEAARLARELRSSGIVAELGDETFRLKKSFEMAERARARYILIVREQEVVANMFGLKLLETGVQVSVARGEIAATVRG